METVTARVVVADDNPSMTGALKVILEIWGWEVVVAHDGMGAVTAIREARPDVALIDIGLPRLDGLEVARLVRAEGVAPRLLVALSGYGEERDRRRSRHAGFDTHLVKPIEPEVLRSTLESVWARGSADHAGSADVRARL
jgi:DNA-binding response OmpR family regulator